MPPRWYFDLAFLTPMRPEWYGTPGPHREPRLLLYGDSCSHSFCILNSFLNRMFVFIIIGIGTNQKISWTSEMVSRLGIVAAILLLPNLLGGCLVLSSAGPDSIAVDLGDSPSGVDYALV